MKIAIVGNGNIGSGLAAALSHTSHKVTLLGHDADIAAGTADADVVVLATPYGTAAEIAAKTDFADKIVVDLANPVTADFSGLLIGHDSSAAEETAKAMPKAHVVKAFNTIFAQHYATGLKIAGRPLQTFVAADNEAARITVKNLATDLGLEAVDAGPLKNARYLEPLGFMNIQFGYGLGLGTEIAPTWQLA